MRISKVSTGMAIHSATLKIKRINGATIKAKKQINISAPQPVEKFLKKSGNDEFPNVPGKTRFHAQPPGALCE